LGSWAYCGHDENKKPIRRIITSITLRADVRGPGCMLERVCIWSGENLIAEIPRFKAEHIGYFERRDAQMITASSSRCLATPCDVQGSKGPATGMSTFQYHFIFDSIRSKIVSTGIWTLTA
jgi:hypothetical protein